MPTTQNWLSDTQATVTGGMDGGKEPELIAETQGAYLRNVSTRGGRMRSRPRIVKRCDLPTGLLQGASTFSVTNTILSSINGMVYETDPVNGYATAERSGWLAAGESSLGSDAQAALIDSRRNSPKQPRVWFCETVGSLVMQDDQSLPFIYDGNQFRRSDPANNEVPVGSAMAYGNSRLAVAINSVVRIGNITEPKHQSELVFTETYGLQGGGDFSLPSKVLALSVIPVVDTASGQGSHIVGCVNSTHTLNTQITAREQWDSLQFEAIMLPTRGVTGGSALIAVNQDLYFRSSDGLRSVRTSRADYDAPGLASLSSEVRHRFEHDTQSLLQDCGVVCFDNRVLCTHSPFVYGPRSMAQGLIALNFDTLSSMGQKAQPVYDGEWDGVLIAQIFVGKILGVDRCFILGRDPVTGINGLWEILPEVAQPTGDDPTQVFESRMFFGDSPGNLKNLRRCDIQFSDILGDLDVRCYFRPEKYPYWITWDSWTLTRPTLPATWGTVRPGRTPILSTRSVPETVDPQTGRLLSVATGFQVRIEWDGNARLDYLQVFQEDPGLSAYADAPATLNPDNLTAVPNGAIEPQFWYGHPVSPLAGIS